MSKKPTGLAAFTHPKLIESPVSHDTTLQSDGISPRKKRGGGQTVALTVKVRRTDWQRLRQLADAEGTTIQAMAEVGLSAVMTQHGLPPLEPHTR